MNDERFEQECVALLDDATKHIMKTKGREYAGSGDRLANFKRGSTNTGVNPETVLFIYMQKHFDSLTTFIKDLEKAKTLGVVADKLSEPIQERIKDMVNYLLLLNGLIVERGEVESEGLSGVRRYPILRSAETIAEGVQ